MSSIGNIHLRAGSKYLSYYDVEAIHRDGSISPYYMVSRNPDPSSLKAVTGLNPPDGVIIFGILDGKLVLVRQYRYPVGTYVYELPAGLVEPGEDITIAAVREMYEETGLTITPNAGVSQLPPFFTTIGMTDESCATVFGVCTGTPTNQNEEDSEDIEVILADKAECLRILREEKAAIETAYLMLLYISSPDDPFSVLKQL